MSKRYPNYTLSDEAVKQLEEAIRSDERAEVVQRATAIRMLHLQFPLKQVAIAMNKSHSTISGWWERYEGQGLEGLANRPRSGRPPKVTDDYLQQLELTLKTDPTSLGYPFTVWTVDRLRQHLQIETGIQLSADRLRVLLKQQGYVWRRPKYVLNAQQDEAVVDRAIQVLDELKKEPTSTPSSYSIWMKAPSAYLAPSEPVG